LSNIVTIVKDNLSHPAVLKLVAEHSRDMYLTTPAESVHTLSLNELRVPAVTFWTVWMEDSLVGCMALLQLDDTHAEIKSMHVVKAYRGQGIAQEMMKYLLNESAQRGLQRLSLETGVENYFAAARNLYSKNGFTFCQAFGNYKEDPLSVFMTLSIPKRTMQSDPTSLADDC
jgi:putative acetyltransferase